MVTRRHHGPTSHDKLTGHKRVGSVGVTGQESKGTGFLPLGARGHWGSEFDCGRRSSTSPPCARSVVGYVMGLACILFCLVAATVVAAAPVGYASAACCAGRPTRPPWSRPRDEAAPPDLRRSAW